MPDDPVTNVRQFVVTNVSELLERLAYYGIVSVSGLYLTSLGYGVTTVGLLFSILLPLPYIVPLLTGAVAEKVGYKPAMLAAFVAYASGFLLMASASHLPLLVTGIVLLGFGAGMFKPLTAATVAHVTSPKHRSLGYNLYYMGINIGGFLGPVLIYFFGHNYRAAFVTGAGIMGLDFLLILTLFRNPVPPQRSTKLLKAFKPLAEVLKDRPFIAILAIFSGFWFLYSMNFTFLTLYLETFVPKPAWFDANLQQAIDPAFVILLGIPLGKFAEKSNAIRMMTVGIALSVAGFLLLGFVRTFPALVTGIIVSTAGEVLAYPGFLSYVSRIAPRDRVAVYQGYGFLPIFVGFFLGPLAGGPLYQHFAQDLGRPAVFWAIMAAVGLASIAAFLLYSHLRTPRPERRRAGPVLAALVVLLAPALIGAGALVAALPAAPAPLPLTGIREERSGTLTAGQPTSYSFNVPAAATPLSVRVTWSDPMPANAPPGATNRPDRVTMEVRQDGKTVAMPSGFNEPGGSGVLDLSRTGLSGNVTVTLRVEPGDVQFQGVALAADHEAPFLLQVARAAPS